MLWPTMDDVSGTVYISLIVKKDGTVTNVQIKKGLCQGCEAYDNEALRLVKLLPKWKPATIKGRPVASRRIIPVKFLLN